MKELIKKIIERKHLDEIYDFIKRKLFMEGPTSTMVLELLSYLNIFAPEYFEEVKDEILEIMGVFYKNPQATTLQSALFKIYGEYIKEKYQISYTPMQANIVRKIKEYKNFSFSAPTSTGKSYVFRKIIEESEKDVVIIVPSRALINEYYARICKLITDKSVNILTFVDLINTKHAKRSIFILTPERAKELFKFKDRLNVEMFLFDEAQLSDEESVRGLYFDSIVRRTQKAFPTAKYIFAHPFISNPDAQLYKNKFDLVVSKSLQYQQKNVGQIFFSHDGNEYYHFGIDKEVMGKQKIKSKFDPMMEAINNGRSILIYTTKASIYDKSVFDKFAKYLKSCTLITDKKALNLIEQLIDYIGATDSYYHSNMIEMIKHGIVTHHGSLPLQARLILECFTQQGFCRICFATSTLEQGINMPFDVVYLNTFEASRTLSMKNLIGRAGRSTDTLKFDYGSVVVKTDNMSAFRTIMLKKEFLSTVSLLDTDGDEIDVDYKEFKEAINNGEFSDEFNLTNAEVNRLKDGNIGDIVANILRVMFEKEKFISLELINCDKYCKLDLYKQFIQLYKHYLNGRELSDGEESVLKTAIKILIWKVHSKSFKEICWHRYAYAACVPERRKLAKQLKQETSIARRKLFIDEAEKLSAQFIRGYDDLPNSNLHNYSLYEKGTKATVVDYDRIVFDTYDYLDKLIGFKLSDIFYAIFYQYYEKTADEKALRLSNFFKYGTDDNEEILMLRYGFSFEEIEWIRPFILDISLEEIVFDPSIKGLSQEKLAIVERYF
ncbi:DEAD/DEAH box helicase [uncultured Anaeromusa sp.]|uniref:DEAD/DEAH box helicase n=1 Tax=uncultured Anaeromusa sp. TaxID=673273 RepID=UPI0029C94FC5|nr:DEAD/DEAH box helicase [uncultured Anaeromusa sp.]